MILQQWFCNSILPVLHLLFCEFASNFQVYIISIFIATLRLLTHSKQNNLNIWFRMINKNSFHEKKRLISLIFIIVDIINVQGWSITYPVALKKFSIILFIRWFF